MTKQPPMDEAPFRIDPRLEADSLPLVDLPLCTVRLMNDQRFPWLLLIPRRPGMAEVLDLSEFDQQQLWFEMRRAAAVLDTLFAPDKLNLAALGNQVRQLHVHVLGRFESDAAWPGPVWGAGKAVPYAASAAESMVAQLRSELVAIKVADAGL